MINFIFVTVDIIHNFKGFFVYLVVVLENFHIFHTVIKAYILKINCKTKLQFKKIIN